MVNPSPSNAGGAGSFPGWYASPPKNQNIKEKQYCNKFNKDFKNGPHQKKFFKKEKKGNQTLRVHPDLLRQNLHCNKIPGVIFMHLKV